MTRLTRLPLVPDSHSSRMKLSCNAVFHPAYRARCDSFLSIVSVDAWMESGSDESTGSEEGDMDDNCVVLERCINSDPGVIFNYVDEGTGAFARG